MKQKVLDIITEKFITSHDFNGIPIQELIARSEIELPKLFELLESLIKEEKITLTFASHSENPHIKRLPDLSIDEQIKNLSSEPPYWVCAYPVKEIVESKLKLSEFDNKPFTKRLYCAEPQLTPVYFELGILETYFRDPRYIFAFHDNSGNIHVRSEHYESEKFQEKHKIFIQTFGIGYDSNKNRIVVVYLRYLQPLSPEHQQVWNAHRIDEKCTINSDYLNATLYGAWPRFHSVYHAFCEEQIEINKLALLMGKPNLFNKTFREERPEGFFPMLRPTSKNYYDFIHILDKLISENINRDFFKGDIPLEEKITSKDGSIETRQLGTIKLLENWLNAHYRDADGNDVSTDLVKPFKELRRIRQTPAHKLNTDEHNFKFPKMQDEILGEVKMTFTKLRLILMAHPNAREKYSPPDWLDGDKIVFY